MTIAEVGNRPVMAMKYLGSEAIKPFRETKQGSRKI